MTLAAAHYRRAFPDFPHALPVVVDRARLKVDTLNFIRASGYEVNATCYGWLPGTIAPLDEYVQHRSPAW